jgi:hypothetical protein
MPNFGMSGDPADFLEAFKNPPAEYGLQPFWFWNGDLEPRELIRQVDLMHEGGVTGFVIHARKGLTVEYLSEGWFERVGLVLQRARELGMVVWIYDEENWASGYAGGRVLQHDASLTPQCLSCEKIWLDEGENLAEPPSARADDPRGRGEVVAAYAVQVTTEEVPPHPLEWHGPHKRRPTPWHADNRLKKSYGPCQRLQLRTEKEGEPFFRNPGGRWLITVHRRETTEWYPAYTDEYYVDVLRKETAPIFLETTHEEYSRRLGEFFGSTIIGFFVDEPGLYNNFWDRNIGSIAWTEDFAEAFRERKRYDLLDHLIALHVDTAPAEDGRTHEQIRFDYYDTVAWLMQERFMRPIAQWCERHGVQHTGHLMLEEFMVPMARYAGNPFMQLSTLHTPGVDRIDEVYEKLAERIASSVAHFTGRKRILSETYALIGWKLAPQYMKEIFDYQAARGVNLLSPHGFYYSIEGFRKEECPPSEFFQNPWWPHFKPFADYVRRTCFALSQGKPVKDFLLYYPIETIYANITPDWPRGGAAGATHHARLQDKWHPAVKLDADYVKLVVQLEERGLDFDLIDYSFLKDARVVTAKPPLWKGDFPLLEIGDISVGCLVLAHAQVMAPEAAEKVREFVEAGGFVCYLQTGPEGLDLGHAEADEAPTQLITRLITSGRLPHRPVWPSSTGEPFTDRFRTQLEHSMEERHVAYFPYTYTYRLLDNGDWIAFSAQSPLQQRLEMFGFFQGPKGRTKVLDPVTGRAEDPLDDSVFGIPLGKEMLEFGSIYNGSCLAYVAQEPFPEDDAPAPADLEASAEELDEGAGCFFQPMIPIEENWTIIWDDGTEMRPKHLMSWSALGRPFYSGSARYRLKIPASRDAEPFRLEATLFETAEVFVNGQSAGAKCFEPFLWNLGPLMRRGENTIEIVVANTLQPELERQERVSGLIRCRIYPT